MEKFVKDVVFEGINERIQEVLVVLYSNSIIDMFLWENRKEVELIKVVKECEIYKIKNTDILLYIQPTLNSKNEFNNKILINAAKAHNLKIDTIKDLCDKCIFS